MVILPSQVLPLNPSGQMHVYSVREVPITHVPPVSQGNMRTHMCMGTQEEQVAEEL